MEVIGKPKFKNEKLVLIHSGKYPTKAEENRNQQFKEVYKHLQLTDDGKRVLKNLGLKTEDSK